MIVAVDCRKVTESPDLRRSEISCVAGAEHNCRGYPLNISRSENTANNSLILIKNSERISLFSQVTVLD